MKGLLGKAKIPIAILSIILLAFFVVNFVLPSVALGGSAVWTTDAEGNIKNDFQPGENVYVRGSEFNPDSTISISITRPDGVVESCDAISCNPRFLGGLKTSDGEGYFVYVYDLNGITGEYKVSVSDGINSVVDFIFTDARTIQSATLDGGSSVSVPPSTSITAAVTVAHSGAGHNWDSTKYLIEGQTAVCVDHGNHHSSGTDTESFSISAPSTSGVYDVSFWAYSDDYCSSGASAEKKLVDGITVTSPAVCNNGVVEPPEVCDDSNNNNCDGCKGDCSRLDNVCGDGIIECGEGCDDHNTNSNDGCSSTCQVENGWTCSGAPSVCKTINKNLSSSCGIDIMLIMDVSGSIDSTELAQMKTAFTGFVDAFLPNTPTEIAVVKFDTQAQIIHTYSSDAASIKSAINGASGGGFTNWQDALSDAHTLYDNRADKPDLYVFASDGNPNRKGDPAQTVSTAEAVAAAVIESNHIKLHDIRIITLGIGTDVIPANLIAISSTDAYYSSGFDTLAQTLAALADDLCGGTITVKKLVDNVPTSGWTFSTSVAGGTSNPTSSTTGGDGFINPVFDINISGTTATVDVTETLLGGYGFVSASCVDQNQQSVGSCSAGACTGIVIGKNDAIYCEFHNSMITCPSYNNPQDCIANTNCQWCGDCSNPFGNVNFPNGNCIGQNSQCQWDGCKKYCGAQCESDADCLCSQDGCQGPDYYDYPQYGDCTGSCSCDTDTGQGQPCAPTITRNAPQCTHAECGNGQCILVAGEGTDLCTSDSDCYHSECRDMTCVQINEPGINGCSVDDDCYYWKCDYGQAACVKAPGNQVDECRMNHFVPDCAECINDNPDCSNYDLQAIATCTNTPDDSLGFTWDTHPFVDSICDKRTTPWVCTRPQYGDVTNVCDKATCGAECDSNDDCQPYIGQDNYCYINGQCDTDPTKCTCSWTQDGYCPIPGTVTNGICYYGTRTCTESGCGLSTAPMGCKDTCDSSLGPIDTIGPTTSNLVAKKVSEQCKININATETDTCSNIVAAEYFLGGATCGDPGTGDAMNAKDGNFNSLIEDVIANNVLVSDGSLNIHVRGKDAAGNWGPCMSIRIDIDCIPPDCPTNMNVNGGTNEVLVCGNNPTLGANICDSQSKIQLAEYFVDTTNPLNWHGINMSASDGAYDEKCEDVQSIVDISQLSEGTHYIKLHGKDGQENWGKFDYCPVVSFVKDTTKPKTTKSVSNPKHACEQGENCDWYITQNTEITLTCYDFNPNNNANDGYNNLPGEYSDDVTIHWKYRVDGGNWQEFSYKGNEVKFKFPEDTTHELEYWCSDACGNGENHHSETDIVDTQPPVTSKNIIGPQYLDSQTGKFYIDGVTEIELTCNDLTPHPVDHTDIYYRYRIDDGTWPVDFTRYTGKFSFPEESKHELEYYCIDALGNEETHKFEIDYVDKNPPVTTKTYGTPLVEGQGGYPKWINSSTPITLTAQDNVGICQSGVKDLYYRYIQVSPEYCADQTLCQQYGETIQKQYDKASPMLFGQFTFTIPEESCHLIEYYAVDNVEKTENVKRQCVYVENTPPVSQKTLGTPKHACNSTEQSTNYPSMSAPTDGCYFITQNTPITITCTDQSPHPVNHVTIKYKDWIVGQTEPDWTTVSDDHVTITKTQDSAHVLKWYCVDALGNSENLHTEYDIVDTQKPTSSKSLGNPKHVCEPGEQNQYYDPQSNPAQTDGCYFINQSTLVTITCNDGQPHPVDHVKIWYRTYLAGTDPSAFIEDSDNVTFNYDVDSAHVLEWYCVDELDNRETTHVEYDIVDTQKPTIVKTIVGPQFYNSTEEKLYIDGVTKIHVESSDPEPHPSDHVTCDWDYTVTDGTKTESGQTGLTPPFDINFLEESTHVLTITCRDALGNSNTDVETFIVDKTAPTTTKTYGNPRYPDDSLHPKWITSQTSITLTVDDTGIHKSGIKETNYRVTLLGSNDPCESQSACNAASGSGDWLTYREPFAIGQESCHLIEYYSVDNVNKTEVTKKQCVYVDNSAPLSSKTLGTPKHACNSTEQSTNYPSMSAPTDGCYFITQNTPITITCTDQSPHPVNHVTIKYKDWIVGQTEPDWTTVSDDHVTITKTQDSAHVLKWYCVDALGNSENLHTEYDIVDTKPPVSQKSFDGTHIPCSELHCAASGVCDYYINQSTKIILTCTDQEPHPVDHEKIYYRYTVDGQPHAGYPEWTLYTGPIQYDEDSQHTLEWYCVDELGNTEQTHTQTERVDTTSPETTKTVGTPKWGANDYWVTSQTPITLVTVDKQASCAAGPATLYYQVWWDSNCDGTVDVKQVDNHVHTDANCNLNKTLYLQKECLHEIRWYAVDALGNKENGGNWIKQQHMVDNTPPHVLILKPVDGWYSNGEDISIVAEAEDLNNVNSSCEQRSNPCDVMDLGISCGNPNDCNGLGTSCAVGIENGKQCYAYLVDVERTLDKIKDKNIQDIMLENLQLETEGTLLYNSQTKQCEGYATVPLENELQDGVYILVVGVADRLGNSANSLDEIGRAINERCGCDVYDMCEVECVRDALQDIVTIWNLPKIGVDNNAPVVTITTPEEGTLFGGEQVPFSADVIDSVDGQVTSTITSGTPCYVTLGGVSLGTVPYNNVGRKCSGTIFIPQDKDFPQGTQPLKVEIADNAGNLGSDTVNVNVDTVKPTLSIIIPSQNQFVKGSVEVTAQVSDANLDTNAIKISTDNGQTWHDTWYCNPSTYCYDWDTTQETDGMAYGIIAKATDLADNTGYSEEVIVIVDNGSPEGVYVIDPVKNDIVEGTITLKTLATDYVSGIESVKIYVESPVVWNCDATLVGGTWQCGFDSTDLSDGQHQAYAVATDNLGHQTTSAHVPFIIDNNAPTIPTGLYFEDPDGDGFDKDGVVTLRWSPSSDTGSGIDYYEVIISSPGYMHFIVPAKDQQYTPFVTVSDLYDSVWHGEVKAWDKAGHASDWTDWANITVDTIKPGPITMWTDGVENPIYDTNGIYKIFWTGGNDANFKWYDIVVDGVTWGDAGSPYTGVSSEGLHTYKIIANDYAGWSTESNEIKVFVDTVDPEIEITGTVPGIGFFIATYSASDSNPSSGLDRVVSTSDGYALCSGTFPTGFCTVFLGSQLTLTVYDKAGNSGSDSTTGTERDITPPTIIYTNPSGVINYNEVTLQVNTNEPSTCYYGENDDFEAMTLMTADSGKITHTADLGTLTDGLKVYHVMCEDLAGNMMDSSKTIVFYVDTTGNHAITIPDYGNYWSVGWNTFFLPKLILDDINFNCGQEPYTVEQVLASLNKTETPTYTAVWYYNGQNWDYYEPGYEFNDLTEFNDEISNPYFIHMISEDRLEIESPVCGD